jgi:hypothetical protein
MAALCRELKQIRDGRAREATATLPPATRSRNTEATIDARLEQIARTTLGVETLETRHSDGLDFHDLAVWTIKDALRAAYEAGQASAK